MSTEAMAWAWRQVQQLDFISEKIVLLRLADFADHEWSCFPSITTIARDCCLNDRTARRTLARLVEMKLISVEARFSPKGDRTSNRYYLKGGVSDPHPPVVQTPTLGASDPHHVEPSLEPSLELDPPISPQSFEAFWKVYPRKQAKGAAKKAWDKAVRRATPEAIIEGALRYRNDLNREDQFTAHGASWLNADRWLDEPNPRPAGPQLGVLDSLLIGARREIANADVAPNGRRVGREDGSVLPELPSAGWDGS